MNFIRIVLGLASGIFFIIAGRQMESTDATAAFGFFGALILGIVCLFAFSMTYLQ